MSKTMILKPHFQLLTENCRNCVGTLMSCFFIWLFTLKVFGCSTLFLSTKCNLNLTRVRSSVNTPTLSENSALNIERKVHLLSVLSAKSTARDKLFSTNKYTKFSDKYIIIPFFSPSGNTMQNYFFCIFRTLDALTPIVFFVLLIQPTPPTGVYLASYQHSTATGLSYTCTAHLLMNMFSYLPAYSSISSL